MKAVAVGIVKNVREEFLFVSSQKLFSRYTHAFYPPGGNIRLNERPHDCVVREFEEELGAIVIPGRYIALTPGDVPDQITYWIECKLITKPEDFQVNRYEIADVQWRTRKLRGTLPLWPATERFFRIHIDRPFASGERER